MLKCRLSFAILGSEEPIRVSILQIIGHEHEPVYVANAQLEELDYTKLYQAYSSKGRKSAAEPRIMFKLLVYGYMCGIYSTRKLELACPKNIDFIWLLQGERVRTTLLLPDSGAERRKMQ